MIAEFLKLAGVKIDPKKVNEVTEYSLKKLNSLEQSFSGIASSLRDLVELKKEEIEILKKRGKNV